MSAGAIIIIAISVTGILMMQAPNGFIVALTYSSQSEWVKNVLAADSCELKTVGRNPFAHPARMFLSAFC